TLGEAYYDGVSIGENLKFRNKEKGLVLAAESSCSGQRGRQKVLQEPEFEPLKYSLNGPRMAQLERDKPTQGVAANTIAFTRSGVIGFIDWLDDAVCSTTSPIREKNWARLGTVRNRCKFGE